MCDLQNTEVQAHVAMVAARSKFLKQKIRAAQELAQQNEVLPVFRLCLCQCSRSWEAFWNDQDVLRRAYATVWGRSFTLIRHTYRWNSCVCFVKETSTVHVSQMSCGTCWLFEMINIQMVVDLLSTGGTREAAGWAV